MTKTLTPRQVAQVAARAGFRGEALVKAVAVALAESGGRPRVTNTNHDKWNSVDRGLWQINSHWHPEVSAAAAFDPNKAAQAAYRISNAGRDWHQWSTWNNGTARAQLGRARIAAAGIGSAKTTTGVQTAATTTAQAEAAAFGGGLPTLPHVPIDPLGLVDGIKKPLDAWLTMVGLAIKTGAWISDPHNWMRIAMVSGGTTGLLLGLGMLAKSGAVGTEAAAVASLPGKTLKAGAEVGLMAATGGGSAIAKGAATVGKTASTAAKGTAKTAKAAWDLPVT